MGLIQDFSNLFRACFYLSASSECILINNEVSNQCMVFNVDMLNVACGNKFGVQCSK